MTLSKAALAAAFTTLLVYGLWSLQHRHQDPVEPDVIIPEQGAEGGPTESRQDLERSEAASVEAAREPHSDSQKPEAQQTSSLAQASANEAGLSTPESGLQGLEYDEGQVSIYLPGGELEMSGPYTGPVPVGASDFGDLDQNHINGLWLEYDSSGQIVMATEYLKGNAHGSVEAWYPDGSLKARVTCEHGRLHNYCEFYAEDGSLDTARSGYYAHGDRLEDQVE